jgi:DNA modification methylase
MARGRSKRSLPLFEDFGKLAPQFRETYHVEELLDRVAVARDLRRIDWAFDTDDTTFLTHDVHPYPAKFIPQIPGHLIARLSLRGDLVLDPFGGSGTTALEAVRLGRRALVVDANPVGLLIGRVKTCRLTAAASRDIHALRSAMLAYNASLPATDDLLAKYRSFIPDIPNRTKWFPDESSSELALIRAYLQKIETPEARDVALLAMSRIILRASFQDSETRYAAKSRAIAPGETLADFVRVLDVIHRDVQSTASEIRYGVATFLEGDTRNLDTKQFPDHSVDLIVTSPPYGNAMDYHLYHRFRMFWLGLDPRDIARIEIGSHLRHQKEHSGFDSYRDEMLLCMRNFARVLRPGRYLAVIIGDSIYEGRTHKGADLISDLARRVGLDHVVTMKRPIHPDKRSFLVAGRRATSEAIVVLQAPPKTLRVTIQSLPYKPWPYEENLRLRELETLTGIALATADRETHIDVDPKQLSQLRKCAFTHRFDLPGGASVRTWQGILENGLASVKPARKDPKYATHGIHPFKGKFYPQLAKALLNLAGLKTGATVLDPFCGSGTTLLEAYLNGLIAHGLDLHPLAAKIAQAKVSVLELDPALVGDAVETLSGKIMNAPATFEDHMDQFPLETHDEIHSWFAKPVVAKLNWLLRAIRATSAGILQDFLEVILSSVIRDVSHQEPTDLRIRRRKVPVDNADVLHLFQAQLLTHFGRLERYWSVRGYCPHLLHRATVVEGDSKDWQVFTRAGLGAQTVDAVVTSPPYATALPYIDTDRLSLLVIHGLNATRRRPLEEHLTGSREIRIRDRREFEENLVARMCPSVPKMILNFIRQLFDKVTATEVGFRRRNLPALLLRYFKDMQMVLRNVMLALKPGGQAFVVMGDNTTSVDGKTISIPTTQFVSELAQSVGLAFVERIPISVTTEDYVHIRHTIRENVVLRLKRLEL